MSKLFRIVIVGLTLAGLAATAVACTGETPNDQDVTTTE